MTLMSIETVLIDENHVAQERSIDSEPIDLPERNP